jgi:hypothetical protein
MDANQNLPNPTFVLNRQPDQGYSSLGDGSDYGYQWGGQTPLDTDYLSTFLLPSEPDIVKGFLDNFLETQSKSGYTDFQVGMAGQRGNYMATPILVNLTWRIYQSTQDVKFLKEVFPKLLSFIQAWFDKRQDRDGDGLPEWERSAQMGFEEHPLFSYWQPWSLGGDISKTEGPSLCAFLYNEIHLLIKIAHILGETSPLASLEALADNLKSAVRTAWHESDHIYRNWDRESHFSTLGEILGERSGSGEISLNRKFQHPVRLVFKFLAKDELPNQVRLFIHGVSPTGSPRIERIETDQFRWHFNQGNVTSDVIYSELEFIEVVGPDQEDVIIVSVMDLYGIDQSLLLPLWAGIPERERARLLVKNVIMNPVFFWKPSGISACVHESSDEDHPCAQIQMIWNNLIGEGMLRYGYRKEAAELVSRLMSTLIKNLKTSYSFFSSYHAISGAGIGDRNSLRGLAPIGLFLKTLGVQIISPIKIKLEGENPFPWMVTIKYKGLTVVREKGKTKITFPGGQTAVIKSEKPRIVTLESEHE